MVERHKEEKTQRNIKKKMRQQGVGYTKMILGGKLASVGLLRLAAPASKCQSTSPKRWDMRPALWSAAHKPGL